MTLSVTRGRAACYHFTMLAGPALAALIEKESARIADLAAVYLFGSASRAGAQIPSDIDLGLLWKRGVSHREKWSRAEAFAQRIEVEAGGRVDLIDLEDAPLDLQHRVLTEGTRVWDAAPVYRLRFETTAISVAIDFLAWRRPYVKQWLMRVSRGR